MLDKISGSIMLSWGVRRFFIAFGAGAIANLSLPPFDFFAFLFISFPILVWLLDGSSDLPEKGFFGRKKPAFIAGWSFGFGYFTGGLWWLGNAVLANDEKAYWALPLAVFVLPALLAIFYGLAAMLARFIWSDGLGRIFSLAASFGLFEYLRATLFTGFPWNTIGYGAMPIPVAMQSVEVIGIFGISIFTVFVASVPALFATKNGLKTGLVLATCFVSLHLGYGIYSLSQASIETSQHIVRIVQPSIDQTEKWDDAKREDIFQTYLKLSATPADEGSEQPSIIIWPETAVPYILTKTPAALAKIADTLKIGQTLITGAIRLEDGINGEADRYFNTVYVINDEGQIIDSADKQHLVPFGEYLPFEKFARSIGLTPLADTIGGLSSAERQEVLNLRNGLNLLPLICYEAIFPQYAQTGGDNIDALINLTNDAWYGVTPGPYQHLRQAQIRAVETGLPLIRAGNNGISVFTDGYGRITHGMELNHIGVLDSQLVNKSVPFWNKNSQFMLFLIFVSLFFMVGLLSNTKIRG